MGVGYFFFSSCRVKRHVSLVSRCRSTCSYELICIKLTTYLDPLTYTKETCDTLYSLSSKLDQINEEYGFLIYGVKYNYRRTFRS